MEPVDTLIAGLAGLSLRDGRSPIEASSTKPKYNGQAATNDPTKRKSTVAGVCACSTGENTIQDVRSHLTRVRLGIAKAGASPAKREKAARQEARGLLKVAQAGLRNKGGGSEPLRLACDAIHALTALSPYGGASELTTAKLWYQAIVRSVDLKEFTLGLRAAAYLQACLDQYYGGAPSADKVAGDRDESVCLTLVGEGGDDELRLRAFTLPLADCSLDVAKLVSGASLNACRCCLGVASKDALCLMAGELGSSAGVWIDRVSGLGEAAKAEAYRDHLFQLLSRACSALDKPNIAAEFHQRLAGRRTALGILAQQEDSWKADVFVAHAHRAAVAMDRVAGGGVNVADAAKLSVFCMEVLCGREGVRWPSADDGECERTAEFRSTWVDWLQHSAGLQEKAGDGTEAQKFLQRAYEYVRCCAKLESAGGRQHGGSHAAACTAYAGILKVHAAAIITSQYPLPRPRGSDGVAAISPSAGKRAGKKRAGKRVAASSPSASAVVRANVSRGLEYLEEFGEFIDGVGAATRAQPLTGVLIVAAVKAWTWAQKSCGVAALWMVESRGGGDEGLGEIECTAWSELNVRGRCVVGDLSRKLAAARKHASQDLVDRIPPAGSLSELAVESYLRAAQVHLTALTSEGVTGSETNGEGGARRVLLIVEQLCDVGGNPAPPQTIWRAGAGWFGLGKSLLDRAEMDMGIDALVRGCRLLERWADTQAGGQGVGVQGDLSNLSETFRVAQLDLRLSKLSKTLQDSGELVMAAAAAGRALAFCPDLCRVTSDEQLETPAGALTLVERYVACSLRCCHSASPKRRVHGGSDGSGEPVAGLSRATVEKLTAYLWAGGRSPSSVDGGQGAAQDMLARLRERGFPSAVIARALLAECRAYRSHLELHVSEGAGRSANDDSVTLSACVEGHRRATESVLKLCESKTWERTGAVGELVGPSLWEARARMLAARFEHDLFLVDVETRADQHAGGNNTRVAGGMADLSRGVDHAERGAEAAFWFDSESSRSLPVGVASAGVCACIRAILLRDQAEPVADVKGAMRQGLDVLSKAVAKPERNTANAWFAPVGLTDPASPVAHLEALEAHYTLHGDTSRRVKSTELRAVLVDRLNSSTEETRLPRGAESAAALGSIGAAFQAAGLPALGPIYSTVADQMLCELGGDETNGAGGNAGTNGGSVCAQIEAARVAISVVRGRCLAEQGGDMSEAERTLMDAKKAASCLGSKAVPPATVAHLECLVGMGLSWMFERSGRLAEAMCELRQVLRLCHAWASTRGRLSASDWQMVSLSAAKGTCIHDEKPCEQDVAEAALGPPRAEEGLGEESEDVEGTIGEKGEGAKRRSDEQVALSSRWIPIYLEGLTGMGRLWRARGFASKASGYTRQGCVASEPLSAARFLRRHLLEEIAVAAGMHRFERADRLLCACQDLLTQERQELTSAEDCAASRCASCGTVGLAHPRALVTAPPIQGKGKSLKRGTKKAGGKVKHPVAPTVATGGGGGHCVRCHELALNVSELLVAEAALRRKQGDFGGALAACERGQAALAPLLRAASAAVNVKNSLSVLAAASDVDSLFQIDEQAQGIGWRALEILGMLRLQQGRAAYLLGNVAVAEKLLRECAEEEGAPVLVRATALYRLGRMRLDERDLAGAKPPLERAEALSRKVGVPKLVRKVRRALAVVLCTRGNGGPRERVGVDGSWRVAALASLSVGVTHCNQFAHASARRDRKGERSSAGSRLFDVVSGGGAPFGGAMADGRQQLDGVDDLCVGEYLKDTVASNKGAEWPIVSLCLAAGEGSSKRFLLTRIVRGRPPLTVSVPLSPEDTDLLGRWLEVMAENRDTLRGNSTEEAANWGYKEKAAWWKRRAAVDEAVGALLRELEERWLKVHGLAALLVGEVEGEGLGSALEGVFDFAKDRVIAAHRTCREAGGKGKSAGKSGKRARGAVGCGEEGELGSGMSELIRVCVLGGETMDEDAWFAVVKLALPDPASEGLSVQVSREIHNKAQATFAAAGLECGNGSASMPPKSAAVKSDLRSSLDIEQGRSVGGGGRGGKSQNSIAVESEPPRFAPISEPALSKMKVADLRRELSARGIAVTGLKLKMDLLARLKEAVREDAGDIAGAREPNRGGNGADVEEEGEARCDRTTLPVPERPSVDVKAEKVGARSRSPTARYTSVGVSDHTDSSGTDGSSTDGGTARHPVILVLDEELQAIPWEGLPCLRSRAVTRVPAVPFVFSALSTRWDAVEDGRSSERSGRASKPSAKGPDQTWVPSRDGIRLNRGFYVLDPEANLPSTRKQLGPILEGFGRRLGWSGVEGKAPSEDAMIEGLQGVDLFAYCGHGAGELLVGRDTVAGLTRCPVAILMGCSSGRMKGYGDFEPLGMVSSYLAGGSPAVVANLWDVTDRDIDRFSVALLEAFVEGEEKGGGRGQGRAATLAHAVAGARSECKMPFIIGHAPVCYGIPVSASASSPAR